MLILNRSINNDYGDALEQTRDLFTKLAFAIGTDLLLFSEKDFRSTMALGKAVLEKNYEDRSFSESGCFKEAVLNYDMRDHSFRIYYRSTSETEVIVDGYLDNNQDPYRTDVTVKLPEDRARPGRVHYEELTKQFFVPSYFAEKTDLPRPKWVETYWFEKVSTSNPPVFFEKRGFQYRTSSVTGGVIWMRNNISILPLQYENYPYTRVNIFAIYIDGECEIIESFSTLDGRIKDLLRPASSERREKVSK